MDLVHVCFIYNTAIFKLQNGEIGYFFFYIHLFRGGGEGNPIIWQHDTRVKNGTIS